MPPEMVLAIASYLSTTDLKSFAKTCRLHHDILIEQVYAIAAQITQAELPPVFWAAERGYFRAVQGMIDKNSDLATHGLWYMCIDANVWHTATALHWAAKGRGSGISEVMDILLKKGGNINARDGGRAAPLHWACSFSGVEVAEALLNRHADLEAPDAKGETPIKWAARAGNGPVLRLLIEKGAELNGLNVRKETILHTIFHQGSEPRSGLVQTLFGRREFNKRDMLHQRDITGHHPFHLAAKYGDCASIELMLGAGYPIDKSTTGGETALLLATEEGAHHAAVLLLSRGADPNPDGGHAILSAAVETGDLDIIGLLMARGQNHVDETGGTPLHWAVNCGNVSVIRYLIGTWQVNVNARNQRQMTPLIQLCAMARPRNEGEIAGILLGVAGIEIDAQDDIGRTALLAAVWNSNLVLARALISANANRDLPDEEGNLPSSSWNDEILEALESAGN